MQGLVHFGKYFGFVILIGLVLQFLLDFDRLLLEQANLTFDRLSYFVYLSLYPILIGILFAIPHIFRERKNVGKWTYDWVKGVAIGLPLSLGQQYFYITTRHSGTTYLSYFDIKNFPSLVELLQDIRFSPVFTKQKACSYVNEPSFLMIVPFFRWKIDVH